MDGKAFLQLMAIFGIMSLMIWLGRPKRRKRFSIQFTYLGNDSFKIKSTQMATIFKPNQFAKFQVAPVDDTGKELPISSIQEGSVEYESPDPDAFTVTEDENDETIFTVTSSPNSISESKSVDIKVRCDADPGDGVRTIEGILTCVLEPRSAAGFGIKTLQEPQDVQ